MVLKKKLQGILLVTVLAIVTVVVMFLTVITTDLRAGLYFSRTFTLEKRAYWAALGGLAYAEHMIQLNSDWCGNATAAPLNSSGVEVEEQYVVGGTRQCNVSHGLINNGEGEFYITFASPDGTIKPAKDLEGMPLTYYSYNRLKMGGIPPPLPVTTSGITRQLPANALYVAVEGRTRGSKAFVEAIYLIDHTVSYSSASLSSGMLDVAQLNAKSRFVVTDTVGDNPRIISNDSISISDKSTALKILDLGAGQAVSMNSVRINNNQVTQANQGNFGISVQVGKNSSDDFPRIGWDRVIQKFGDPEDSTSVFDGTLKAGTYAFLEGNTPATKGIYTLTYFNREYTDDFVPDGTGISFKTSMGTLLSGSSVSVANNGDGLASSALQMTINGTTGVKGDSAAGLSGIAVAAYDWDKSAGAYTSSVSGRAKLILQKNSSPDKTTSICSTGQVRVNGELSGSGAVVSGDKISFEGKSELQPDPASGMAVYAKGPVEIKKIAFKETVNDPSDKFKEAVKNYRDNLKPGEKITDLKKTAHEVLDTMINTGDPKPNDKISLRDRIAANPYNYGSTQAQDLVMALLTKNTTGNQDDGYDIVSPSTSDWCDVVPRDSSIKGVIYTWKSISADLDGGSITLKGTVVAYGGDPQTQNPGEASADGTIRILNSQAFNLIFDPNYFSLLGEQITKVKLKKVMYNQIDR